MGAIVAALHKEGGNAVPKVIIMLKELTHRGTDAHGVATPTSVRIAKLTSEISVEGISSSVALGHNFSRSFQRDRPQPVLDKGFALVFEGRLFPLFRASEIDAILNRVKHDPQKNAWRIIEELDGSYTFAIACSHELIAGRDSLGNSPLYYGENEVICAVASERKALWALNIKNVKSFPPGNLAVISANGFSFKQVKKVEQPSIELVKMKPAARRLQNLLLESMKERVSDVEKVAVAFSGGLDSSLVAVLAKTYGKEVQLVWVGLEGQPEATYAKASAEALRMPLHSQAYDVSDIEHVLPKVLWLIEEPNVIKASIAIPFYWAAEVSSKLGCRVLLAGQGSDELFGGYKRYLRVYAQSGVFGVQDALYHDVAKSYETNFQRDEPVCAFHKVELRLPFMDRQVVQSSLSLPTNLNIESKEDPLRKRVLRQVAQNLGMPPFIANKTKRAIQYSTGVNKALRTLARRERLSIREYVKNAFQEVYPNVGT